VIRTQQSGLLKERHMHENLGLVPEHLLVDLSLLCVSSSSCLGYIADQTRRSDIAAPVLKVLSSALIQDGQVCKLQTKPINSKLDNIAHYIQRGRAPDDCADARAMAQ